MERWKFFDITHREHVFCNPISEEKINHIIGLLHLQPGQRVLDLATGKGEFVLRLAEKYKVAGYAVDLSPYFIEDANKKFSQRSPQPNIQFVLEEGKAFVERTTEKFDLVSCLGASWIFGNHEKTLAALSERVVPGGWIVVGEPYWRISPPRDYLEAIGEPVEQFATHYENMKIGERLGLTSFYSVCSSQDDWDVYEGLQVYAAESYAASNPEDPDLENLLERVRNAHDAYLRWGRDILGWAVYIFRRF
jgi:SAM-dependent methyltransferase